MIKLDIKKRLLTAEGSFDLDVKLDIEAGDCLTLYGKSGAGKTTTLRILAGLTEPDEGLIRSGETTWFDSTRGINLPPQQRRVGLVFQDYALFPNMTVRQNLEYALDSRRDAGLVDTLLEMMDLQHFAKRKPETLSGGQRQRVALARALVRRPQILLLDEPLAALDMEMRLKLQEEILKLHKQFHLTTILVSHHLPEIFKLSDRVVVIDKGRIVKSGGLTEVFIGKKLSGKYKFEGEILAMQKSDVVHILTVSIGNNLVKVIATEDEAQQLRLGDKVIISSKAFNPILLPVK